MAVKTLWEAALRTGSTDPAELVRFLKSDGAAFDGHKGEPLRFGAEDHQLHQPLYRVTAGAGSTEVAGVEEPSAPASTAGAPLGEGPRLGHQPGLAGRLGCGSLHRPHAAHHSDGRATPGDPRQPRW